MSTDTEQWREIDAKGVKWLVSSAGNIRAPARTTTCTRTRNGVVQSFDMQSQERALSTYKTKRGYLETSILFNGKRIKAQAHRLIALAWVPGFESGLTVNHIDGDKLNNRPDNLEWVSVARNSQHAWEAGLVDLRGENNPQHKLTTKQVVYIRRLLASGIPSHTLAVVAGVDNKVITRIRDGRSWPTVTARRPVSAAPTGAA